MNYKVLPCLMAISLSVLSRSVYAALPVNSVNNGQIIQSGAYANTANNTTTFINTQGTGLWLKSGGNIRGVEVDSSGNLTNNGGSVFLDAPNQVVRLDGNIDVRGILNSSGNNYLGNGGKVLVDAAYLFQNGNIYANGINGGLVQFNVGALTMNNAARIEAQGNGGQGGVVAINASGPVDIAQQAVIDTSGKVAGTFDTNVINIEGSAVNVQGDLIADGVQSRGGTIRLVSTGQTDNSQTGTAIQNATTNGIFSQSEETTIQNRLTTLKSQSDGNISIGPITTDSAGTHGVLEAGGASGNFASTTLNNDPSDTTARTSGDGGTIILTAQNTINNAGWLYANGGNTTAGKAGNGGTISVNAGAAINNTARIVSDGGNGTTGGDGGLITMSYVNMANPGVIRATGGTGSGTGGNGGLTVLSSLNDPTGTGTIINVDGTGATTGKAGNVVLPQPLGSTNTLVGIWDRTQPMEMLVNAENGIILKNKNLVDGQGNILGGDNLADYTAYSQIRSLQDQAGDNPLVHGGVAEKQLLSKLMPLNSTNTTGYFLRNFIFSQQTTNPIAMDTRQLGRETNFQNDNSPFNTMTFLSAGTIDDRISDLQGSVPSFGNAGGYFSVISPSFLGGAALNGEGGINIATTGLTDLTVTGDTQTLFGGSLIAKSLSGIINDGEMSFGQGLIGGNVRLISQGSLTNNYYINTDGNTIGGNMVLKGLNSFVDNDGFETIQANGGNFGGTILIQSNNATANLTDGSIQANGSIQNGTISLQTAN